MNRATTDTDVAVQVDHDISAASCTSVEEAVAFTVAADPDATATVTADQAELIHPRIRAKIAAGALVVGVTDWTAAETNAVTATAPTTDTAATAATSTLTTPTGVTARDGTAVFRDFKIFGKVHMFLFVVGWTHGRQRWYRGEIGPGKWQKTHYNLDIIGVG